MTTIFSKIISGEIPSYLIDSNDNFFAFLDINPLVIGHTLVVPRIEIDYIFDLDAELLANLFCYAQKIALKLKLATNCNRVAVIVLGMDVPHAHIHLIPMNSMEDVDFTKEKLHLSQDQFESIKEAIIAVE